MQKKVIVLGVIFLALILLFVLFVFMGKKNPNAKSATPGVQNQQKNQAGSPPQDSASPDANLSLYTSSYFSFSYPSIFGVTEGIASTEGYTMFLESNDTFSPKARIVIQANPSDKVEIEKIKNSQIAFGLVPTASQIGVKSDIPVTAYKGVLPFSFGKVQKTVVLFEKNGYVYKIDLSYPAEKENLDINTFFASVLSSFQPR